MKKLIQSYIRRDADARAAAELAFERRRNPKYNQESHSLEKSNLRFIFIIRIHTHRISCVASARSNGKCKRARQ
jgi:hypothetical protein